MKFPRRQFLRLVVTDKFVPSRGARASGVRQRPRPDEEIAYGEISCHAPRLWRRPTSAFHCEDLAQPRCGTRRFALRRPSAALGRLPDTNRTDQGAWFGL